MFKISKNNRLVHYANKHLKPEGQLVQMPSGYVFLKIHDDYTHKLIPFVANEAKSLPNYFSQDKKIGAHISVIYPEELPRIPIFSEVGNSFSFEILEYFEAKLKKKDILAVLFFLKNLSLFEKKLV